MTARTLTDPYDLPHTFPAMVAAAYHGIGRDAFYERARVPGALPFRVYQVGRRLRVTRTELLHSLDLPLDRSPRQSLTDQTPGGETPCN